MLDWVCNLMTQCFLSLMFLLSEMQQTRLQQMMMMRCLDTVVEVGRNYL